MIKTLTKSKLSLNLIKQDIYEYTFHYWGDAKTLFKNEDKVEQTPQLIYLFF